MVNGRLWNIQFVSFPNGGIYIYAIQSLYPYVHSWDLTCQFIKLIGFPNSNNRLTQLRPNINKKCSPDFVEMAQNHPLDHDGRSFVAKVVG